MSMYRCEKCGKYPAERHHAILTKRVITKSMRQRSEILRDLYDGDDNVLVVCDEHHRAKDGKDGHLNRQDSAELMAQIRGLALTLEIVARLETVAARNMKAALARLDQQAIIDAFWAAQPQGAIDVEFLSGMQVNHRREPIALITEKDGDLVTIESMPSSPVKFSLVRMAEVEARTEVVRLIREWYDKRDADESGD